MPTTDLKKELLSYIDKADNRLLKMMKDLAESYQEVNHGASKEIPDWQKEILDQRLQDHSANPEEGRKWEDVKAELVKKHGL